MEKRKTLFEKYDELVDKVGIENVYRDILLSMSTDELRETWNWLARNYDIEIEDDKVLKVNIVKDEYGELISDEGKVYLYNNKKLYKNRNVVVDFATDVLYSVVGIKLNDDNEITYIELEEITYE